MKLPTEEEKNEFYLESQEVSEEILDFLTKKKISAPLAIFASMQAIGALAVVNNIPKEVFVGLASNSWEEMKHYYTVNKNEMN